MRKRLMKLTLLGVLVFGSACATEFRSPWICEKGPLRYRFEKGNPDKYSLSLWSAGHRREAHKAFMNHGTDTKPLTALFFNKSDFKLNEIFYNSEVDTLGKDFNPYLNLLLVQPRATYYEWGATVGGRFEYPVWQDKGRIGLRASVPFRTIEIEREDLIDKNANPAKDFVHSRFINVPSGDGAAAAGANAGQANAANYVDAAGAQAYNTKETIPHLVTIYNLGFVSKLFATPDRQNAFNPQNNSVRIFGNETAVIEGDNDSTFNADIKPAVGIIYSNKAASAGGVPGEPGHSFLWSFNARDDQKSSVVAREQHKIAANGTVGDLRGVYPAAGVGFFDKEATNYAPGIAADQLDKMWIALGREQNGNLVAGAETIERGIVQAMKLYQENPYEWFLSKGAFEFETQRRTGLGDIDLDLFYEHTFSDEWIGEVMLGVRVPTGGSDKYYGNPYRAHLGNGEHWEIKLGGLMAWKVIDWMNIKLDAAWSFVLEATEHRAAAFKGAKIKNIGPKVDADVDWGYFTGRLDFNFTHPKTKNIYSTLGYEFYYKTEDNFSYKKTKLEQWTGPHFQTGATLAPDVDHTVAEKNTQAIGHKVRFESGVRVNEWFEIFYGGSYTFAGQNLPRETDVHCGFNVGF